MPDQPRTPDPAGNGDPSRTPDPAGESAPAGEPVALLAPRDGTPAPLTDHDQILRLAEQLAAGSGPIALDTERASGFRYDDRAFLIQLRRAGLGTVLIDPTTTGDLAPLTAPLADAEWVLHAASQDLPCLAELGLRPRVLFDTELAGRLAGLPKVGLGPLTETMLGVHLAKGHGAEDWSRRPLPPTWLDYAALDVELLIDLRDALAALLRRQHKLGWAEQEFAAIVATPPPAPKPDRWRRTKGLHHIRDRRALAVVRELYGERDALARRRDRAPHRILPDSAIIDAATTMPATRDELTALPVFSGPAQRRQAHRWLAAIDRARRLPDAELPPRRLADDGPPPAGKWARHDPAAAARLTAARHELATLSDRVDVPVENLVTPSTVRKILWEPPAAEDIPAALAAAGARPWQRDLVTPLLIDALRAPVPDAADTNAGISTGR